MLKEQAILAKETLPALRLMSTQQKNEALSCMAHSIITQGQVILSANAKDVQMAKEKGRSSAFVDRLTLNMDRLSQMAQALEEMILLPDPLCEIGDAWVRPNGLRLEQRRVPLGVIGIIYESRPNVTVDAAALCLKSGNACILRGGSDAFLSNQALMKALIEGATSAGVPVGAMSLVQDTKRQSAQELMGLVGLVDVLIPRGGKALIQEVVTSARVPVIQTGDGVCHVYVDGVCDMEMAQRIAVSAKISRPSVCNAAETLLVDAQIADQFLPACLQELAQKGVTIRGDERTCALFPRAEAATDADWGMEYNDLIYSVKIVSGVEEAIAHIAKYTTYHSECIVTNSLENAMRFEQEVDAACVYVNASTRFTDGGEFGFGAEIGISNQKLHVRGPIGLRALTSTKYVIRGQGHIR